MCYIKHMFSTPTFQPFNLSYIWKSEAHSTRTAAHAPASVCTPRTRVNYKYSWFVAAHAWNKSLGDLEMIEITKMNKLINKYLLPHLFAHGQIRGGLQEKQPQQAVAQVCQAGLHGHLLPVLKWWRRRRRGLTCALRCWRRGFPLTLWDVIGLELPFNDHRFLVKGLTGSLLLLRNRVVNVSL